MRSWAKWLIEHRLKWIMKLVWIVMLPLVFMLFVVSEIINYTEIFRTQFVWLLGDIRDQWRKICSAKANTKGGE